MLEQRVIVLHRPPLLLTLSFSFTLVEFLELNLWIERIQIYGVYYCIFKQNTKQDSQEDTVMLASLA